MQSPSDSLLIDVESPDGAREREAGAARRYLGSLGVVATGLAVAAFALRLPGLAQPLGINQGVFSAVAWGLQRGLLLYRDVWDQKPPGIHLTYWLGFQLLGAVPSTVFWLDTIAVIVTGGLLALLADRLGNRVLAWTTLVVWSVLSLPAIRYSQGGFLERAIPETFIAMLAPAAILCSIAARRSRRELWQIAAGFLVGICVVFKPTAGTLWPLVVVWSAGPRPRSWLRAVVYCGLGVAAPPALVVLWFWMQGIAGDAWVAIIDYNRAYVHAAMGETSVTLLNAFAHDVVRRMKTDPLWMGGMVAVVWCLRTWWTRTDDGLARLLPWWLGLTLLAALGGGVRLYNAYFIPCLPPLAMLVAWTVDYSWRSQVRVDRVAVVSVLVAALAICVRTDTVGRLWTTTLADLRHDRDPVAYLERFGSYGRGRGYSARANHELVKWLAQNSDPTDQIYIFGMEANVYFEAQRLPANRFVWVGPAVEGLLRRDDFTLAHLADDLAAKRPRFIIREANNGDNLLGWRVQTEFVKPPMQSLLSAYDQAVDIEDFTIYRRRP